MHAFAAQGSEQKRKACINFTRMNLFNNGIVMEIHCHITGICEAPMSSSLFSQWRHQDLKSGGGGGGKKGATIDYGGGGQPIFLNCWGPIFWANMCAERT